MRARRDELIAHVGGRPNVVQRRLIENAAWLSLKLELLNERMLNGEIFKPRDHNHYLAWANALRRTLVQLGVNESSAPAKTLAEVLASGDGDGMAA